MQKIKSIYNYLFDNFLLLALSILGFLSSLTYVSFSFSVYGVVGRIYRIILLILFISFFFIGLIKKKFNLHPTLLILSILYIVGNIFGIFISPIIYSTNITFKSQLEGLCQIVINCLCIYLIYYLITEYKSNKKDLTYSFIFLTAIGLFLCLYSLIFQYQNIINTFRPITTECKLCGWNADVTSIYTSKTVFGLFLLVDCILTITVAIKTKKYWLLSFSFLFFVFMFIARAKTSLLTIFVFVLLYICYYLFKKDAISKKDKIAILISVCSLSLILLLILINAFGLFNNLHYFIVNTIFKDGVVVLNDRFYRWSTITHFVKYPTTWLFGMGERISDTILINNIGFSITDDGYLNTIIISGIFALLCNAYLIFLIIRNCSFKRSSEIIIVLVSLFFNFLFENNQLIGLSFNRVLPILLILIFHKNMIVIQHNNHH